jgi:hypothetical protein
MKPARKPGSDRFFSQPRIEKRAEGRNGEERRETLVLLAIVFLIVANVVLYLCHHYGLTSLNDGRAHSEMRARVIVD